MKRASVILAILALVSLGSPSAWAGTWTPGGVDTNWNTAGNWDTNPTIPGTGAGVGADAIFATTGTLATVNIAPSIGALTFNASADFVLTNSAQTITMAGDLSVSPSTAGQFYTVWPNLTFSTTATKTWTIAGGSTLKTNGNITGGTLLLRGTGLLYLNKNTATRAPVIDLGAGSSMRVDQDYYLTGLTGSGTLYAYNGAKGSFYNPTDLVFQGQLVRATTTAVYNNINLYGAGKWTISGQGKLWDKAAGRSGFTTNMYPGAELVLDCSLTGTTVDRLTSSVYGISGKSRFTLLGQDGVATYQDIGDSLGSYLGSNRALFDVTVTHGAGASATLRIGYQGYLSPGNGGVLRFSGTDFGVTGTVGSRVYGYYGNNGFVKNGLYEGGVAYIGDEFVTYVGGSGPDDGTRTITKYVNPSRPTLITGATTTANVLLQSDDTVSASQEVYSLKIDGQHRVDIASGQTLTLGCGGIIASGTTAGGPTVIAGGTIYPKMPSGSGYTNRYLYLYALRDVNVSSDINTAEGITIFGGGAVTLSGALVQSSTAAPFYVNWFEGDLNCQSNSNVNINSINLSSGRLTKGGTGTMTIGATQYNTGGTYVQGGTLLVNASCAIGLGPVVLSGGTLLMGQDYAGSNITMDGGAFEYGGYGRVLGSGVALTFNDGKTSIVRRRGTNGNPTWTQSALVYSITGNGTMRTEVDPTSGSQVELAAAAGSSTGFTGNIEVGTGPLLVSAAANIPPKVGKWNITSTGCLWLSNDMTVTGHTFVGSGTMLLNSNTSGTGTVRTLTAKNLTFSPGDTGTSILTLNGNLTFATTLAGSTTLYNTLKIDVLGNGTTAGTDYDRLLVTTSTVTGGLITSLTNANLSISVANGLDFTGKVYTILSANNDLTLVGANTVNRFRNTAAPTLSSNLLSATVNYGGVSGTGTTGYVTLSNLQYAPGLISGLKFSDSNANGTQDAGEPALANWPINLTIGGVTTPTFTDGTGAFSFSVSTSNSVPYTITEGSQTGWRQTSLITSFTGSVGPGETRAGLIFGNQQLSALSGMKFNDANHNGVKDTGEVGLEGWTISLFNNSGTLTAVTDTNGAYSFANVIPGSYTLTETGSTGWTQSFPVSGSWAGTVDSGATIGDLDFGNYVAVTDIPGDINRDHIVDQADYTVWYNHYGQTPATWSDGDVTGDNIVDQADYTVWYNHYGQTGGNVPEPMTMALLAIGGLAMLRRRK